MMPMAWMKSTRMIYPTCLAARITAAKMLAAVGTFVGLPDTNWRTFFMGPTSKGHR